MRAEFVGPARGDRLSMLHASIDIFVHTGPHETFCQAAQEALASGVPVVAPAAGGLLDLVDHGRNGLLYPAGSPVGLRNAVEELVDDRAARGRLAAAARTSVLGRSWEAVTDDYLEVARELLAERPSIDVGGLPSWLRAGHGLDPGPAVGGGAVRPRQGRPSAWAPVPIQKGAPR